MNVFKKICVYVVVYAHVCQSLMAVGLYPKGAVVPAGTYTDIMLDVGAVISGSTTVQQNITVTDTSAIEATRYARGSASKSAVLGLLSRFTFSGNVNLTTMGLLADTPQGLGSLPSSLKTWDIGCSTTNSLADNLTGQTAKNWPNSIEAIRILDGAFLFATANHPLTIAMGKQVDFRTRSRGDNGLIVQANGSLTLNGSLSGTVSLFVAPQGELVSPSNVWPDNLKSSFFGAGSVFKAANKFVDGPNGTGKVPNIITLCFGSTDQNDPQTAAFTTAQNISVDGYLASTTAAVTKCGGGHGSLTVNSGGTFKVSSSILSLASVKVEPGGVLDLDYPGSFVIPCKISIKGGTLKIGSGTKLQIGASGGDGSSERKIFIEPGSTIILSQPLWKDIGVPSAAWAVTEAGGDGFLPNFFDMDTDFYNRSISLRTDVAFTDSKSNFDILRYNTWYINHSDQTLKNLYQAGFVTMYLSGSTILGRSVSGYPTAKGYTLYGNQSLYRVKGCLNAQLEILANAIVDVGTVASSDSLDNWTDTTGWVVKAGGTVSISQSFQSDGKTDDPTNIVDWSQNFQKITFDPHAALYTSSLFKDDANNVGKITCNWFIDAPDQTATCNSTTIPLIFVTVNGSLISTTSAPFTLFSGQTLNLHDNASFSVLSGVATLQKGCLMDVTDANVFVTSGATVLTDMLRFGSNLRRVWFQDGSHLKTIRDFKDDGLILPNMIWDIACTSTAVSSSDYQQAANASSVVKQINVLSGAYMGVAPGTTFLLSHTLNLLGTAVVEVLPGGTFIFNGGDLNIADPATFRVYSRGTVVFGASSEGYDVPTMLEEMTFSPGSTISVGLAATLTNSGGILYEMSDDKKGIAAIPEGVNFIINNGVQTLLNLSPTTTLVQFDHQGILEVSPDYPLTLLPGQTIDLHDDTVSTAPSGDPSKVLNPYRFFIRSNSILSLYVGARFYDRPNTPLYTLLGTKAPIIIETDALTVKEIPGWQRWRDAAISTYSDFKAVPVQEDRTRNLFNGAHTDMDNFGKTTLQVSGSPKSCFNYGAVLVLNTMEVLTDNADGVGAIPFTRWDIACTENTYKDGQTISSLPQLRSVSSPYNGSNLGTTDFLKTINVLKGSYVFSFINRELNVGQYYPYKIATPSSAGVLEAPKYKEFNIQSGGTLHILDNSLNAVVGDLYLYSGCSLICDGVLTVKGKLTLENGANISGVGTVKVQTLGADFTLASTFAALQNCTSVTYMSSPGSSSGATPTSLSGAINPGSYEVPLKVESNVTAYIAGNVSLADNGVFDVLGTLDIRSSGSYTNNEDAALNIHTGGLLMVDKEATTKNMGVVRVFGALQTNNTYFQNDNVSQAWLEVGSRFITTESFEDGLGAIAAIPSYVQWVIASGATQTTHMTTLPGNILVDGTFQYQAGSAMQITKGKVFALGTGGALNTNGQALVVQSGATFKNLSQSALAIASGEVKQGGTLVIQSTTSSSTRFTMREGSFIQTNDAIIDITNWMQPSFSGVQWNIAGGNQEISSFFLGINIICVMKGVSATYRDLIIPASAKLIVQSGASISFTNDLTVQGTLQILKGATLLTPNNSSITVVSGGTFITDGEPSFDTTQIAFESGSSLKSTSLTDSAGSFATKLSNATIVIGSLT